MKNKKGETPSLLLSHSFSSPLTPSSPCSDIEKTPTLPPPFASWGPPFRIVFLATPLRPFSREGGCRKGQGDEGSASLSDSGYLRDGSFTVRGGALEGGESSHLERGCSPGRSPGVARKPSLLTSERRDPLPWPSKGREGPLHPFGHGGPFDAPEGRGAPSPPRSGGGLPPIYSLAG